MELGTILVRLPKGAPHFRLTRGGSKLDLEIAVSGVSAKLQPHGFFSPAEHALKRRVT